MSWTDGLLWWALENTLFVGALIGIVAIVCRFVRLRPAVCHVLWLLVLCKLVLPPVAVDGWPPKFVQNGMDGAVAAVESLMPGERTAAPLSPKTIKRRLEATSAQRKWEQEAKQEKLEAGAPGFSDPVDVGDGAEAAEKPAPEPESREEMESFDEAKMRERATAALAHLDDAPQDREASFTIPLLAVPAGIWILGIAVALLLQARRIRCMHRLATNGTIAPLWLAELVARCAAELGVKPPDIRVVSGLGGPVIWSMRRPLLLWPESMTPPTDRRRMRGIVLHELAHLRRRDHWFAWIELAATCLWWWNPLVYIARKHLRHHAELACDAWVVWLRPQHRRAYAEALIDVSAGLPTPRSLAPALAVASSSRRAFERRLSMIMLERAPSRLRAPALILIALMASLILPSWSMGRAWIANEDTGAPDIHPDLQAAVELHHLHEALWQAREDTNWEKVVGIASKMAKLNPDNGEAFHWIGYGTLAQQGSPAKAREAFKRQAELGWDRGRAAYNIACTYALEGEAEPAMGALTHASSFGMLTKHDATEDPDLEILYETDEFKQLLAHNQEAIELHEAAKAHFDEKNWSSAVTGLKKLAEVHGNHGPTLHQLGFAAYRAGEAELAFKAFKHELKVNPKSNTARYNIACALTTLGDHDAAFVALNSAVEHGFSDMDLLMEDPDIDALRESTDFNTIVKAVAWRQEIKKETSAAFEAGEWDKAAELCTTMIDEGLGSHEVHHYLGFALHQMGEYDAAIEAWTDGVSHGDSLPRALYNIGCAYSLKSDPSTAVTYIEKAVAVGFDDLELMQSDNDLASLRSDARFVGLIREIGDGPVLEAFGAQSWEDAYEIYTETVAEEPENGRAWLIIGFASLRLGNLDQAMDAFQRQQELGFAEPIAIYNQSCVLAARGEIDEAVSVFEKAIDAGFNQIDFAIGDPDMYPLHSSERFKAICAEALEKMEAEAKDKASHEGERAKSEKKDKEKEKDRDVA